MKERLTKEINFWNHRAEQLKLEEKAGKSNARLNSQEARRRADELQARLRKRLEELDLEGQIAALPPVVLGGLVVVPMGLLAEMAGREPELRPVVDTQHDSLPRRGFIQQPRASAAPPWVRGIRVPNPGRVL